jgi:hypothetical protein
MQEYGWFHWNDLGGMLWVLRRMGRKDRDARKFRLAACAFVRRVECALADPLIRSTLEIAEAFADHRASREQIKAARRSITGPVEEARHQLILDKDGLFDRIDRFERAEWELQYAIDRLPVAKRAQLLEPLLQFRDLNPDDLDRVAWSSNPNESRHFDQPDQCITLRDVLGNPFQPVSFDQSWRTETAVLISRAMYDSRDFSAMPILADALQDAGCANDDILNHCRDADGVHVRGCWVVDPVLGKE